MAIEIPVTARLDSSSVDQKVEQMKARFNDLGKAASSLGDVKFSPIDKASMRDMEEMTKRFEALIKAAPGLKDRLFESGQAGKDWHEVDWKKPFPQDYQRTRYMHTLVNVLRENSATWTPKSEQTPSGAGGGGGNRGGGSGGASSPGRRSMPGGDIVNSMLDGAGLGGPGRVVTGSIGTGMAMGAGAGLMGLLGGLAALGAGKLAGMATEKIGVAEDDQVAYDRLKRAIGDVSVSFDYLKDTVRASAEGIHVTWEEGQQLSSEFARLGNVTRDSYQELGDEIAVGGGLGRALGTDPSSGVQTLGALRGVGVTGDVEDSRRMALLIGETIARSGAFARADEVMESISSFATAQTRQSLNQANVQGYAGAFSALNRSGIPGLDPTGVSALLAQVNSSLAAGGNHGDASQFFSASIGARYGLDPFQMQLWREGGAFATLDDTFGPGSVGERAGISGYRGDQTFLQETLRTLRNSSYASNPGMLAHATANHLGVSMSQASALLGMESDQLGGLNRRLAANDFDLTRLNASGISSLASIEYGSDADRREIAEGLLARRGNDALSNEERSALHRAMDGGDQEAIRDVLSQLVASREQEANQGKDIRDTKVAIENLKMAVADRLVPLTQDIRSGILHMAGDGQKSRQQVLEDIARNDAQLEIERRMDAYRNEQVEFSDTEYDQQYQERMRTEGRVPLSEESEHRRRMTEHNAQLNRDYRNKRAEVEAEVQESLDRELEQIERNEQAGRDVRRQEQALRDAVGPAAESGEPTTSGQYFGADGAPSRDLFDLVRSHEERIGAPDGLLWAQIQQESAFDPEAVSNAGARGLAQIMPNTERSLERRFGRAMDAHDVEDALEMQAELMRENYQSSGNWDEALRMYHGGWDRDQWGPVNRAYAPSIRRHMRNIDVPASPMNAPMPQDNYTEREREAREFSLRADPIEVIHRNERGQQVQPTQHLQPRFSGGQPFGQRRAYA